MNRCAREVPTGRSRVSDGRHNPKAGSDIAKVLATMAMIDSEGNGQPAVIVRVKVSANPSLPAESPTKRALAGVSGR